MEGAEKDGDGAEDAEDDPADAGPACTSCSMPLETPGGVKNTGRCRLCAKLHKEGQYCPVCDAVWQWANCPAMVGCDGCDFWVHAACDAVAELGGSFCVENPDPRPGKVSLWDVPCMQRFRERWSARSATFDQCSYGGDST